MRIKKTITRPATKERTEEVLDFIACDKCGRDVNHTHNRPFERVNTKIECFAGDSFPEGEYLEGWIIDCCYECFEESLIPALKNTGFKIMNKMDREHCF